ncbi:MAG: hypothetical protein ACI8SE_001171 [Bacteroidia bacterium]|jgi:hypothetical protein
MTKLLPTLLLTLICFISFGQETKVTDSIWDSAMVYRSQQVQKKIYNMAKDGNLNVYRSAHSETPIHTSEFDELGTLQMQVASGGKNDNDTLIVIPFSTESFVGFGFNRQVTHSFETSSTAIQLDYISLIFMTEEDGLYFSETELFYVSMVDIQAALPTDDINFIRAIDQMAKRILTFKTALTYRYDDPKTTVRKTTEVIEQKVNISELLSQNNDDNSQIFIALGIYLSNNGQVYTSKKLNKSVQNSSELKMVNVLLTGENLYINGNIPQDSITMQFPLSENSSLVYLTMSRKGDYVLKLIPRPPTETMKISFIHKSQKYFIPLAQYLNSPKGETQVHVDTIFNYMISQKEN